MAGVFWMLAGVLGLVAAGLAAWPLLRAPRRPVLALAVGLFVVLLASAVYLWLGAQHALASARI